MGHEEQGHRRRVRYTGTHPKSYKEKYKELQPEKYPEVVEKVIRKGGTPVGMHIPICVDEIIEVLQIRPGQKGLDATLGYGGHTQRMLERLEGSGHLYAVDVDGAEMEKTRARLERLGYGPDLLTVRRMNFADIDRLAETAGPFDFVLADLGVSSMQIDNPDRGFSYKKEGPLDLRLDPERGISAAERLKDMTQGELEGMLAENADEPYAKAISRAILSRLKRGEAIATTSQLRQAVEEALPAREREEMVRKSCQRTFQALRIDVNQEFEVLESFLEKLPHALAQGGRAAILTFHSGEDRIVKKTFKRMHQDGLYREIADEVIRPSAEECARNSRARSAKLRWAVRA